MADELDTRRIADGVVFDVARAASAGDVVRVRGLLQAIDHQPAYPTTAADPYGVEREICELWYGLRYGSAWRAGDASAAGDVVAPEDLAAAEEHDLVERMRRIRQCVETYLTATLRDLVARWRRRVESWPPEVIAEAAAGYVLDGNVYRAPADRPPLPPPEKPAYMRRDA